MSETTEKQQDKFVEQVKKDVKIDIYDIVGDSRDVPNNLQKYSDMLRSESHKMNTIKVKMDEIYHEQFIFYTRDHPLKFNPSDARKLTETDPRMIKARKLFNEASENVEYLRNVMWNLREKTKSISNIIQMKKIELS